ncbi:unnamed protein product, partial [Brassica oleracea]
HSYIPIPIFLLDFATFSSTSTIKNIVFPFGSNPYLFIASKNFFFLRFSNLPINSFTTIAPPDAAALAITVDIASLFSIASKVATLLIISYEREKIGETYVDLRTASEEIMRSVFHHAIVTDLQNKRQGTVSTLTCGEVRGGRIKPRGRYMKVTTEFDPLVEEI